MSATDDFRKLVRKDPLIIRLREAVENVQHTVDVEKVIAEAKVLHESRTSRKLYAVPLSPLPLHEANMLDLKARSRLTQLRVGVTRLVGTLSALQSKVKKHIHVRYAEELAAWSTQVQRSQVVEKIVAFSEEVLEDIKSCDEVLSMYMQDIDKAGYNLTNSKDILKLLVERKDQVV